MALFIFLMGFAVSVFWYANGFPGSSNFRSGNWMPGPSFFPQLLAIILFMSAGTELLSSWRKRKHAWRSADSGDAGAQGFRSLLTTWGGHNAILIIGLMVAFSLLVEWIGFAIMGFLTVFLLTWRLKAGLVRSLLFAAIGVTATMFFFRYVFYMDLPSGLWSPTQYFGY